MTLIFIFSKLKKIVGFKCLIIRPDSLRKKKEKCLDIKWSSLFRTKSEQLLGARRVVQSNASVRSGLRQAKFYPPQQAAAPQRLVYCGSEVHKPQYMRYFLSLVYCCSCTVAAINLKVA